MALTPRLELRQAQTLVMTPQLQQAIKLLQLSNMELSDYVDQELERNPLLEREETETAAPSESADGGEPIGAAEIGDSEGDGFQDGAAGLENLDLADAPHAAAEASASLDVDYDNVYTNDAAPDITPDVSGGMDNRSIGAGGSHRFDDPDYNLENTLSAEVTLRDHLLEQAHLAFPEPPDSLIAADLTELLDDSGYLTAELESVAARLNCGVDRIEKVLKVLQAFEPTGVFARNLSECLALQLKELNRLDPAMQAMLDNLDLLVKGELAELSRVCGVDGEDITDMVAEIKALNPKPGLAFGSEVAQTIVPDIFVRQSPDGSWAVELNSDTLPRVLVNTRYYATVNSKARSNEDKTFISECLNSANWLVKSLNQRANTILRVSSELVRQQDGFLTHGIQHLKPLNLRAIAEVIDMHESTVSRVTSNKYMATPRGVFELKAFCITAIASSAGGDAHSAESVRHRIKGLIDDETPQDVLSDDKIVEILRASGIDIARRTVAKYRESMHIPSSVQRRRRARMTA